MKGAPRGNKNAAGPRNGLGLAKRKNPPGTLGGVVGGAFGVPGSFIAGYRSRKKYGAASDHTTALGGVIMSGAAFGSAIGGGGISPAEGIPLALISGGANYGSSRLGSYVAGKIGKKKGVKK